MNYKTNFGQFVNAYSEFRPLYPRKLYDKIFSYCTINRNPNKIAIDIGAGTGLSTIPLLNRFEKIYSIEPDKDMFKKLIENLKPYPQVSCICDSAEEFSITEKADFASFATSFYWAEPSKSLLTTAEAMVPRGLLSIYRYDFPKISNKLLDAVIQRHLNENWNAFRSDRLKNPEFSLIAIKECNQFNFIDICKVENFIKLDLQSLFGFFTSTSYMSNFLNSLSVNDREYYLNHFLKECKSCIAANQPLLIDFGIELIIAKRN